MFMCTYLAMPTAPRAPVLLRGIVLQDGGQRGDVHRLAQPEVGQLHVAVRVQQQVVRLYVPAMRPSIFVHACS